MKKFARAAKKAPVVAVNNKDKALRVLIVVAPQGADLVLATHIPNSEADVLVPGKKRQTTNSNKTKQNEHTPPWNDKKLKPPSPSTPRALTPQSRR